MVRSVTNKDVGLRVLREAPIQAQSIDIVAVHGLGAHPDDSWCKNAGTAEEPRWRNWLIDNDMLPVVAPNARIMRYGYESQWFGKEAMQQSVSTVAERLLRALKRERKNVPFRPLVFVAHCFGGLVVLKALLEAEQYPNEWPGLFSSTTGLVFFGTPFRGAEGMDQMEMLEAARREYHEDQLQPAALEVLQPGNAYLQELVDSFLKKMRDQTNKTQIVCFFELKSSNVGRIVGKQNRIRFVVSQRAGCLDLSESTDKRSLSRTHFDMNKFEDAKEEDFQTVAEVIEGMVNMSPQLLRARSQCVSKHKIDFSFRGIPTMGEFVARDTEMQALKTKLKELLSVIPAAEIAKTHTMEEVIREAVGSRQEKKKTLKEHANASPLGMRSNSLNQHNIKGPQLRCQTCTKKFLTQDAANGHMTSTGHGSPNIPCKTCAKKFFTQDAANGHMTSTGHGSPNIPCKTCAKKFFTQDAANGHMTSTGHGSPKIPCKTCAKKFFTQDAANGHMTAVGH